VLSGLQPRQDGGSVSHERLPLRRQLDRLRAADDQCRTEMTLEGGDVLAHRRLGHAQGVRGSREGPGVRQRTQSADTTQTGQ
jgi:hypothetical protein